MKQGCKKYGWVGLCGWLVLCPLLSVAEPAPPPTTQQEQAFLDRLTEKAILPLYQELSTAASGLLSAGQAFCKQPDLSGLQASRTAWGETLLAWARTDVLLFGPAIEDQVDFRIFFNPPKKSIINGVLKGTKAVTQDTVHRAGVGGQGLMTLEYLLFDREQTAEQSLAAFSGEGGASRCAYLMAASELLQESITQILTPWQEKKSAVFVGVKAAEDVLINKLYQSAESITKNRLGKPMGALQGGQPMPYELEAWRSGYGLRIVRANVEGMERILVDGGVLDWLQESRPRESSRQIAGAMKVHFGFFLGMKLPKEDPFNLLEQGRLDVFKPFSQRAYGIQMGIKRHLAPNFGANLGFNQNDGD